MRLNHKKEGRKMVKQESRRKDVLSTFQKLTRKIMASSMDKEKS
jgi:hypothetical protein